MRASRAAGERPAQHGLYQTAKTQSAPLIIRIIVLKRVILVLTTVIIVGTAILVLKTVIIVGLLK